MGLDMIGIIERIATGSAVGMVIALIVAYLLYKKVQEQDKKINELYNKLVETTQVSNDVFDRVGASVEKLAEKIRSP